MLPRAVRQLRRWAWLFAGALLIGLLPASLTAATPALPDGYQEGDLVAFSGTPHLYVVSGGYIRWLADTRAAAQQAINWGQRHDVTISQLETWQATGLLGDPFLSFPLVREDPPPAGVACCPMHLVKQETDDPQPRLFWIKNLRDVELFGITTQNYGQFVAEVPQFRAQHGHEVSALARADLEPLTTTTATSVVSAAAAAPTPAAVADAADVGHLGSFPPKPHEHLGFTLPPGWETFTGARAWRLSGQTLVTSLYPRNITAILWVTALPGGDYPNETPKGMIRKALEIDKSYWQYTHLAPDRDWPLTTDEILAATEDLTIAGVPATSAEYQTRTRTGGQTNWRLIALRRGNVFWLFEVQAIDQGTIRGYQSDLDKFFASVSFNY
ncbi:MAG: hypothetical protein CL878_15585 [Dehalococcoidia bacterium]|nr:hypothetical protein [Dehalococcoidia bacterium]